MTSQETERQRAEFYQSHRDRESSQYKKKHRIQYDAEFFKLTEANEGMSVLEIGCGTGLFLRYLEDRGFAEIVGVDMDPGLEDVLSDLKTAEIHFGDVLEVLKKPLAGRKFDRIVMLDVAEHIQFENLVRLLSDLKADLKPGGQLLLRVPNIESPWGLKMFFGTFDHVTPLGPGRMQELAHLTGWECRGIYPQEPQRWLRRFKERIANNLFKFLLSYHPDIWTANLLAVFQPPER